MSSRNTKAQKRVDQAFLDYRNAHAKFIVARDDSAIQPFMHARLQLEQAIADRALAKILRALRYTVSEYEKSPGRFPEDDHVNLSVLKDSVEDIIRTHNPKRIKNVKPTQESA